jgi:deoxycytidylate deaminase
MGAALISPLTQEVIAMGVNSSLYGDGSSNKSDVHAEANCISSCAMAGRKTEGCSIYITMPPCKTCFGLIVAAGIKRIVFRKLCFTTDMIETAARVGVEFVPLGKEATERCLERVKVLWREGDIDREENEGKHERKKQKTS